MLLQTSVNTLNLFLESNAVNYAILKCPLKREAELVTANSVVSSSRSDRNRDQGWCIESCWIRTR